MSKCPTIAALPLRCEDAPPLVAWCIRPGDLTIYEDSRPAMQDAEREKPDQPACL